MTDQEIIAKILGGDRHTVYLFYQTYTPRLQRFIQTKISNPHDAEEVLQDTLYGFLEAIRDFAGKSRLQTFLFSICQHKIIDYYRRKKLKHIVFSQMPMLEELVSPLLNPEECFDRTMLKDKLKRVFSTIVPKYSTILRLKYVEDRPIQEIASMCQLTYKSAESLLFRARKAFAKTFYSL